MLRPRAGSRDCLPQEFIRAEPPDSLRTPIRKKAMLACTYLVYPFLRVWQHACVRGPFCVCALGEGCIVGLERSQALNLWLSSLEPALEEQTQADVIHGCLHSIMAVVPVPEGEDGHQEVSLRVPHHGPASVGGSGKATVGGGVISGANISSPSSLSTWIPCTPLRIC